MEQNSFDKIKHVVSHGTVLVYLNFNRQLDIHTDNSDYQLGAVIVQEGKPITFYSRKLTYLQM